MPYIKAKDRITLEPQVESTHCPDSTGELNYLFTKVINDYLLEDGLSYKTINDVLGALEGAKLEFYRRIAVPYENKKIIENGDVYDASLLSR